MWGVLKLEVLKLFERVLKYSASRKIVGIFLRLDAAEYGAVKDWNFQI